MSTIEERYVSGELDFETAAAEAAGHALDREDLVPILRRLRRKPETAEISEHGAALYDETGFLEDPVAFAAVTTDRERRMHALTSTALTVSEAADRLDVSPSRVRQRTGAGTLWAIKVGNKLLLPRVQFTPTGLVPNLEKVQAAVPRGLHPLSVLGLLTESHAELTMNGEPRSIVHWLRGGGDPDTTLAVVDTFHRASA